MSLAPIVLFVYKRFWHTKKLVESLQKNELARYSKLFVFSDGPQNNDDIQKISAIRDYVRNIDGFGQVNVVERSSNYGLAKSIIDGVTCIISQYKKIIVLEDDLIVSPGFLKYMNDALDIYLDKEKVMGVSGFMYKLNKQLPETFFLGMGTSWGWATWERAWKKVEWDENILLNYFNSKDKIKKFNFRYGPFYQMFLAQKDGKIDSWAIRRYASQFRFSGLYLFPRKSLIRNIGFDGSGTHSGVIGDFPNYDLCHNITVVEQPSVESNEVRTLMEKYFLRKKFFEILHSIIRALKR